MEEMRDWKYYFELLEFLQKKGASELAAIAVLEQLGKEARFSARKEERATICSRRLLAPDANATSTWGDNRVTTKQLRMLHDLQIAIHAGMTKQEAAKAIDDYMDYVEEQFAYDEK